MLLDNIRSLSSWSHVHTASLTELSTAQQKHCKNFSSNLKLCKIQLAAHADPTSGGGGTCKIALFANYRPLECFVECCRLQLKLEGAIRGLGSQLCQLLSVRNSATLCRAAAPGWPQVRNSQARLSFCKCAKRWWVGLNGLRSSHSPLARLYLQITTVIKKMILLGQTQLSLNCQIEDRNKQYQCFSHQCSGWIFWIWSPLWITLWPSYYNSMFLSQNDFGIV